MAKSLLELAGRVGLKALEAFERNKPKREARRARRKAKRDPEAASSVNAEYFTEAQEGGMSEPKFRTSTKSGGASTAGTAVIALIGVFFPEAMDKMSPETAAILASAITAGIGWFVARISKTATNPGIL